MQRTAFLGASFAAATAGAATPARAVGLVEFAGEFDVAAFTKRISRPAEVRQVWDAGRLFPPILGGVKNSLNGLQFGFGMPADAIATAFVTHGDANVLLYAESAWRTYRLGEVFGVRDPAGAVVATNIFAAARALPQALHDPADRHGFYQDASIATLQKRGVMFFVCNTALVEQAAQIVGAGAAGNQTADEVAQTLRRSLVPGAMLVPSGVGVVSYVQSRYHYAYITE